MKERIAGIFRWPCTHQNHSGASQQAAVCISSSAASVATWPPAGVPQARLSLGVSATAFSPTMATAVEAAAGEKKRPRAPATRPRAPATPNSKRQRSKHVREWATEDDGNTEERPRAPAGSGEPGRAPTVRVGSMCSGLGTAHRAMDCLAQMSPTPVHVEHVFACDISSRVRGVLERYLPSTTAILVRAEDVGDEHGGIDVLVCGFPCQPFSPANRRRSTEDPRRHVLPAVLAFVLRHVPPVVILENVPGFLTYGKGLFEETLAQLRGAGYTVSHAKLSSHVVGCVPQRRVRLYIVAIRPRGPLPSSSPFQWPSEIPAPSMAAILEKHLREPAGSLPRAKSARARVLSVTSQLAETVDQAALDELVIASVGPSMGFGVGSTRCLTASRAAAGGFWLAGHHRMMTLHEMLRLQGVLRPETVLFGDLSFRQSGTMIGNAMTQTVLMRLLVRALRASGQLGQGTLVDPLDALA